MPRGRLIAVLIIAVMVLIIILQNMEAVSTRILFVTVTMPRAALLFIAAVFGFLLGLAVAVTKPASGRKQ
jgi:putative membrane protein